MVTPSLYRSFGRSKLHLERLSILYLPWAYYTRVYYTPVSYRYLSFLFKISSYKNKKGTLKSAPPRYQNTRNILVALTTFNYKGLNNG